MGLTKNSTGNSLLNNDIFQYLNVFVLQIQNEVLF